MRLCGILRVQATTLFFTLLLLSHAFKLSTDTMSWCMLKKGNLRKMILFM